MILLKNWLYNIKKRREEGEKKYWESHKLSKELSEKRLKELQGRMLSKCCAINNMCTCTERCIHFSGGNVVDTSFGDEVYPIHIVVPPYCKLWRIR